MPVKVFAAIVATGLMSFCGVIVETSMNIAFPTLMKEFGVSTNVMDDINLSVGYFNHCANLRNFEK